MAEWYLSSKEVLILARKCVICGKGIKIGMQISHSHIRTKRAWMPNLQRVKAIINGAPKRVLVCTRCLRSGKVQRAI
jgi:large subunit ribosomal protein L28